MTIQDVVALQIQQVQGQINAYQTDINNLLVMLGNLQEQQGVLVAWLAANPG